jgi:GTPase SAR1 family protein
MRTLSYKSETPPAGTLSRPCPVYFRHVWGAILVFDMTEEESFQGLGKWFTLLTDTLYDNIPVYLTGNKIDLTNQIAAGDEVAEAFTANHRAQFRKEHAH